MQFEREMFVMFTQESRSILQLAEKLGFKKTETPGKRSQYSGTVYREIHKYIRLFDVDISHMTGMGWSSGLTGETCESLRRNGLRRGRPWNVIFVENCKYNIKGQELIKRLVRDGKRELKCQGCGINSWNGNPIVLQLHHVNGVVNDNREENLEIVCPNCHSQTENWAGRNIQIGRRRKDAPNRKMRKWKCVICGIETYKSKTGKCRKCHRIASRKVERPDKETLLQMINDSSKCAVARKFKVSEAAIRKWVKQYEKEENGLVA